MDILWLFIGGVVLMGALWAINGAITRPRRFIDKDADGEPDKPNGPAKDL